MKTGNILLIGGAILAVIYISNLGIAGATTQYVFNGIVFNSPTNWTVSILVQNVSNANVKLNSMAATASVNGTSIGNVSFFPSQPLIVNANSQINIPVSFSPSILGVTADILSAITEGTTVFDFEISGNANVDGIVVPFDIESNVNMSALSNA